MFSYDAQRVSRSNSEGSVGEWHEMCKLLLVRPSKQYAEQVISYKEEMLQDGDRFDGCAGLENVQSFEEWIDFESRLRAKYKDGYVPSERQKGYTSEMLIVQNEI